MTITNTETLDALAIIAQFAYAETPTTGPIASANGTYVELVFDGVGDIDVPTIDGPLGFQARAFFNHTTNELVIAFAGTEGAQSIETASLTEFVPDVIADLTLAVSGVSPQDVAAQAFILQAELAAQASIGLFESFDVTYVGHSLGGFIAQTASASGPEGEVVVFNSPGAGGFLGLPENHPFPEENFTYIYSDPEEWGPFFGAIHSVGTPLSDNLYFVPNTVGHALTTPDDGGVSTALGDVLDENTMLVSFEPEEFLPVDEALQILGATTLLGFFDDGEDTPASDGLVTGTVGADLIDAAFVDIGDGDVISDQADLVFGLDGADTIIAGAGADTVQGGTGDDSLIGGAGDDSLVGGDGDDILVGGAGNDTLRGGGGTDSILGGGGNDLIYGGNEYDTILAGAGDDTVWGNAGRDEVFLGNGDDLFEDAAQHGDGHSADDVFGGAGSDLLNGRGGDDTLNGGGQTDTLEGGLGQDILTGGSGADTFVYDTSANTGNDQITDFEDGVDLLSLSGLNFVDLTIEQESSNALVTWSNGSITLEGLDASALGQDDFLFS